MKKYEYVKTFTFEGKRYYIRANSELELGMKYEKKLSELKSNLVVDSNMFLKDWAKKCILTYKVDGDAQDRYLKFTNRYIR